jgi:hypothetical protein
MEHCSTLIDAYRASDGDSSVVSLWWEHSPPSADQLVALSHEIGARYLAGQLTYPLASGLMNQLMPLAGWEQAPQRFWQYYVAFEDAETLAEPDMQARLAVQAVANAGVA